LGRSRGGFGSKIHCIADALGNPLGFTITPANEADITQAEALLKHTARAGAVIADKGYDADALVDHIVARGAEAVIPPRSNRKTPRAFDRHKYQARHLIENLFARLKQFRRIATRFEKLSSNFSAIVTIACIIVWLR
jgi:transposase